MQKGFFDTGYKTQFNYSISHLKVLPPSATAWEGGGVGSDPFRFFRNNFFIAYCIDMKLGIPLRASISRLLLQKIEIGRIFFLDIGRIL